MEWTKMIAALAACSKDMELTVYWPDGSIIKGISEGINETCDYSSTEENDCTEYYMCIIRITEIVHQSSHKMLNANAGDIIEVSIMYEPIKIHASGKGIIWEIK